MKQRQPLITQKQRLAAKEIVENGSSVSAAMRKVGYSPETAKDPGKLTRSEGFQYLMREMGLDDDTLVRVLKDGLQATDGEKADYSVRHKYLETGLRLSGLGKAEGTSSLTFINMASKQGDIYDL